jgi:hypothetical protein
VTATYLRHFLPDAIELARQAEAMHHGQPLQQLQSMRTAFSMARGIKIAFGGQAQQAGPLVQSQLLERLAVALDTAGSTNRAVSHCTVIIGEGCGVDAWGRLWLDVRQPALEWARELQRFDMALVRRRQREQADVATAEVATARALGLRAVFAGPHLSRSVVYMRFLEVCM